MTPRIELNHDPIIEFHGGNSRPSHPLGEDVVVTLTSLLPTLRRILPDPIREPVWPEHTHATTTDAGDAAIPGAHTRSALRRDRAVVIVRVTAVLKNWDAAPNVVWSPCPPICARVICLPSPAQVWSPFQIYVLSSKAETTPLDRTDSTRARSADGKFSNDPCPHAPHCRRERMTLMYSITASRSSARQAADLEWWPHGTVHTRDDVIINGSSMVRTAHSEHTPAVRIGAVGGLWATRVGSTQRLVTVLLTRVEQIRYSDTTRRPEIWVDAEVNRCRPILSSARIVGRVSTVRRKRMQLQPHPADSTGWLRLPADIVVGDLIVVPCAGSILLSDVRRSDHHPERLDDERTAAADDDFPSLPSCLK